MTIKLKSIKYAAWNTRGTIAPESVKELAQSIAEQGLINPITIWMDANCEPVCIAGNRRLAALLSIRDYEDELAESEYTIFDGTEHEAKMVTVTENLQREDVGVIEEAALVEQCLADGMTAETIAARTGRSISWVNRRRRLIDLDDAWKQSSLPADALEKIAALPTDAQKRLAKGYGATESWANVRWAYEREMRDLDSAKFCGSKCRKCDSRTGIQPDLFGAVDGKLGRCLNGNCFDQMRREWREKAVIAEVGDAESVEVNQWCMPNDEESTDKRTKSHPCAYYYFTNDDELVVRWGESAEAKAKRREEENARRDAEREAERAERAKIRAIVDKLDSRFYNNESDGDDELESALISALRDRDENIEAAFIGFAVRGLGEYHSDSEWANEIRAFDFVAKLAGLTDEERDYLLAEFPEEDEDEAEDEADEEPDDESEIEDNEDDESEEN